MDSYALRDRDEWRPRGGRQSSDRPSRRDLDGPGARDYYAHDRRQLIEYDDQDIRSRSRSRSPSREYRGAYNHDRGGSRRARSRERHPRETDVREDSLHVSRSDLLRAGQDLRRAYQPPRGPYQPSDRDYYERYDPNDDMYEEGEVDEDPPLYDGEDDIDPERRATTFLLIRRLKESTTEELFARGIEKLYRKDESEGATPGSLRRVLLIRDRMTDISACFAFAEFFSIADAKAAANAADALGEKMTIGSKKVEVSFPSRYNFQQASFGKPERNPRYLFELQEGEKYKYKIPTLYASVLRINEKAPSVEVEQPAAQSSHESRAVIPSKSVLNNDEPKAKKRKTQPGGTLPAQLALWQKKTEELHRQEQSMKADTKQPVTSVNPIPTTFEEPIHQSFIHGTSCYLCKTVIPQANLERHVKESKAHAKHIEDAQKVEDAYAFMKRKGVDPEATLKMVVTERADEDIAQPTYTDRAALRRQEELRAKAAKVASSNQPAAFSLKDVARGKNRSPSPPKPSFNIGSKLLQKSGWKEGQGLGANGEGRTEGIEQGIYAAGVGLGHASSKKGDAIEEAEKATKGSGFADKTWEVARDRFNAMG
ncbi:hypothetical protein K431DRAFT_131622 [Polychaeton citri CBS 116435]|uniref:G-patch domain-containing protein n=1 Tax=Polychaeton citri CBS 116435 TaxID=1314669 RepID=A0A9P4UQN3_9PEZI|nr:hypothetical protein K431DRAFT_131622 [Polychaeton citri CBS 116435]